MRKFLFVAVLLAGCAGGMTVEEQAFVACRAIPPTVNSILAFGPNLAERDMIAISMDTARPLCVAAEQGETTEEVLRAVRDELRRLIELERKLRNG